MNLRVLLLNLQLLSIVGISLFLDSALVAPQTPSTHSEGSRMLPGMILWGSRACPPSQCTWCQVLLGPRQGNHHQRLDWVSVVTIVIALLGQTSASVGTMVLASTLGAAPTPRVLRSKVLSVKRSTLWVSEYFFLAYCRFIVVDDNSYSCSLCVGHPLL
jgi:hypothetical protein